MTELRFFRLMYLLSAALIILTLLIAVTPAHAYTCEDVLWASKHWSPAQIAAQKKSMTPAQRRAAESCIRKAGETPPLGW